MAADPAVYINLGHTYLRAGGDDARKAIALYERAKKLRPDDLTIRLYLAKASQLYIILDCMVYTVDIVTHGLVVAESVFGPC